MNNPLSGSKITAPRAQVERLNKEGDLIGDVRHLGDRIEREAELDEMLETLIQQQHQDKIDADWKKAGQFWSAVIGGVAGLSYARLTYN